MLGDKFMLDVILSFIVFIIMLLFTSIIFILANVKEDNMNNTYIIEVTPNKDGKLFITLYGTKYEIIVKETKTKPAKADKE